MKNADIAAALVQALEDAAARELEAPCTLVSVTLEMLAPPALGQARVAVERRTRSLGFLSATYEGVDGERIATAASVHRIIR